MISFGKKKAELTLRKGEFFRTFSVKVSDPNNLDQVAQAVFDSLPSKGGLKIATLYSASGEAIELTDAHRQGISWLALLIDEEFLPEGEGEGDVRVVSSPADLIGVTPFISRKSLFFRVFLVLVAIAIGGRGRTFPELRLFLRTLQYARLFGWGRELNMAYVEGSVGPQKARRVFTLAVFQFLQTSWRFLLVLFAFMIFFQLSAR